MNVDNETDKHTRTHKQTHILETKTLASTVNVLSSSGMSRNGNQTRQIELRENQQRLETHIKIAY